MINDDEFSEGGYRFRDLEAAGIVSGRTDLARKQDKHGFPKPIKLGDRQGWYPKSRVHAWLRQRDALRDPVTLPPRKPREKKTAPQRARKAIKG